MSGSDDKEYAYNVGDPGLILGLRRSPGEENGNPFQYSCLKYPMDKEPGELQSMGWQRVRQDQSNLAGLHTVYRYFYY